MPSVMQLLLHFLPPSPRTLAFAPGRGVRAERVRVLRGEHLDGDGRASKRYRAARLIVRISVGCECGRISCTFLPSNILW